MRGRRLSCYVELRLLLASTDANVSGQGGVSAQFAGLMQVNARVPEDAPVGADVPLLLSVGSRRRQADVVVALRQNPLRPTCSDKNSDGVSKAGRQNMKHLIERGSEVVRARIRRITRGEPRSRKVFVLGTGRSGTHWIGEIMNAHPDLCVTVEKWPIFSYVTRMALDPTLRPVLYPKLVAAYNTQHLLAAPRHYVDKSHPNLWLAESLAEVYPTALFIAIRRSVFATTSSMLRHEGVLAWFSSWRDYPVPNRFLGVTEQNATNYDSLSLATKCALRWKTHMERIDELRPILGERLLVVDYEALQAATEERVRELTEFLSLASPIPCPMVKRESLNKWKELLSPDEKADIERVCQPE